MIERKTDETEFFEDDWLGCDSVLFGFVKPFECNELPPIKNTKVGLALSSHPLATEIGQKVLEDGGNAIDAAVAIGFA